MENLKLAQEYASEKERMDEIKKMSASQVYRPDDITAHAPGSETIVTGAAMDELADDEMQALVNAQAILLGPIKRRNVLDIFDRLRRDFSWAWKVR